MLFPILGPSCLLIWWPSLMKDMQIEQCLCWSGMTDTEHSTTSGSNEEDSNLMKMLKPKHWHEA